MSKELVYSTSFKLVLYELHGKMGFEFESLYDLIVVSIDTLD